MSKVCNRCGKDKVESEFYTSQRSGDGLTTYCRACLTEGVRQWRAKRKAVQGVREYQHCPSNCQVRHILESIALECGRCTRYQTTDKCQSKSVIEPVDITDMAKKRRSRNPIWAEVETALSVLPLETDFDLTTICRHLDIHTAEDRRHVSRKLYYEVGKGRLTKQGKGFMARYAKP